MTLQFYIAPSPSVTILDCLSFPGYFQFLGGYFHIRVFISFDVVPVDEVVFIFEVIFILEIVFKS